MINWSGWGIDLATSCLLRFLTVVFLLCGIDQGLSLWLKWLCFWLSCFLRVWPLSQWQSPVWLSWARTRTAVLPIQCGVFIVPRANRFNIKLVMKGHQVYLAYEGCGISVIWLWKILLAAVRDFLFLPLGFVAFPLWGPGHVRMHVCDLLCGRTAVQT